MLLGTGRNLRPVQGLGLGPGEAEYEVVREAPGIALDLRGLGPPWLVVCSGMPAERRERDLSQVAVGEESYFLQITLENFHDWTHMYRIID